MTKISDTQSIILSNAAQRPDGNVLPLPGSLRGGAATKVVAALLARGLIRETVSDNLAKADPALNRVWRNEPDGRGVLLFITGEGLAAIDVEPDQEPRPTPEAVTEAPEARRRAKKAAGEPKAPRDSKEARLIAMLKRTEGGSIDEIIEATGWRPHSVRGAIAGALKKKRGLEVISEKIEGRGRVYRIPAA